MTTTVQTLLQAAWEVARHGYAPYTHVAKGAAVQTTDGTISVGCNVELVSWSGSICAEVAAVANTASQGKLQIARIAVVPFGYPCGACLQMLSEFGAEIDIITEDDGHNVIVKPLSELLPMSFSKNNYR